MKITDKNSAISAIMQLNYVIASYSTCSGVSIANEPVIHDTLQAARTECVRLAESNPGKMFIIIQLRGAELVPLPCRTSI